MSLQKEKSGYQIDVSYSEDKANAVLTGNTEKLTSDYTYIY